MFDRKGMAQSIALVLLVFGVNAGATAGPTVIWVGEVGPDTNCGFESFEDAVDGALAFSDPVEIRLTRTMVGAQTSFSTHVWNHPNWDDDWIISGGWDDCFDIEPSGHTVVRFQPGTFSAWTAAPPVGTTLTLRDLDFDFDGGNGLQLSGVAGSQQEMVSARLENVILREGTFGLWVESYLDIEIDFSSTITNNDSSAVGDFWGGGITCGYNDSRHFGSSRIVIAGVVFANKAVLGGGLLASDQCQVVLAEGGWIYSNQASLGGGIFLHDGSDLHGGGNGPTGSRINGNLANHGGGLFVAGAGTEALPYNVDIFANTARVGAGVAVRAGGRYHQNRANALSCPNPPRCAAIRDNVLAEGADRKGSAIFADGGSDVELRQMFVETNNGAGGSLIHAAGSDTQVHLDGVQIWGNDTSVALVSDGADIDFAYSTMALNFWLLGAPWAARTLNGGTVEFWSSILEDVDGVEGFGILGLCVLIDNDTNFEAFHKLVGVDPKFVDIASGDLHLQPTSPAIDYCFEAIPPRDTDYDIDPRGIDHPEVANVEGPYDLGADEFNGVPVLFADGFESGDTSAWSAEAASRQEASSRSKSR